MTISKYSNAGGDLTWDDAADWQTGVVPTSAMNVVLDNSLIAGAYTVAADGADTARSLTIAADSGRLARGSIELDVNNSLTVTGGVTLGNLASRGDTSTLWIGANDTLSVGGDVVLDGYGVLHVGLLSTATAKDIVALGNNNTVYLDESSTTTVGAFVAEGNGGTYTIAGTLDSAGPVDIVGGRTAATVALTTGSDTGSSSTVIIDDGNRFGSASVIANANITVDVYPTIELGTSLNRGNSSLWLENDTLTVDNGFTLTISGANATLHGGGGVFDQGTTLISSGATLLDYVPYMVAGACGSGGFTNDGTVSLTGSNALLTFAAAQSSYGSGLFELADSAGLNFEQFARGTTTVDVQDQGGGSSPEYVLFGLGRGGGETLGTDGSGNATDTVSNGHGGTIVLTGISGTSFTNVGVSHGEYLVQLSYPVPTPTPTPIGPSDRRLKADIVRVGTLTNGLALYNYRYLWSRRRVAGVMADEVEQIMPHAVVLHPSGYKMVDYGKLVG